MAKKTFLESLVSGLLKDAVKELSKPQKSSSKKSRYLGDDHYYYPRGYSGNKGRRK